MNLQGMTLSGGFTLSNAPPPPPMPAPAPAGSAMALTYDLAAPGNTDGLTISVPLGSSAFGSPAPNVIVDWGDGSNNTYTSTGVKSHTYSSTGTYQVTITGTLPEWRQDNYGGTAKQKALISVDKWTNALGLTSLRQAFDGAINLQAVPDNLPSGVTTLQGAFRLTKIASPTISSWNTSNVTNMYGTFIDAVFNQPIGNWNVGNVTNMYYTFYNASTFNQNIGTWNVSNVTDMEAMFQGATSFNQNISSWNVGNVTNMPYMFQGATSFNQNLSSWITGLTSQPTAFTSGANAIFANNSNLLKPFLSNGTTRITT